MSPSGRALRWIRRSLAAWVGALAGVLLGAALVPVRMTLHAPGPSHLIVDRHQRYLGEVPSADDGLGYWPPPYALSDKIIQATLEAEDRHFYDHGGVYVPSVLRAAVQDVRARHIISGASTVAMQVARLEDPSARSLLHKAKEALEARQLIRDFGHDAVLREYLTLAPYGNRVHGIVRAARLYFDKPVEDLDWRQAAFLAALPQMPGRMNPFDEDGVRRASTRARRILMGLRARGIIDDETLHQAVSSDLGLVAPPHRTPEAMHAVLAWSELAEHRSETLSTATLDLDLEHTVAGIVRQRLAELAPEGAGNGAAIVVDLPSGEVLAYVGSRDYFAADSHGAIDYARTKRSPGSALKPFIYALGLDSGKLTAASELPDTPLDFQTADGLAYLPDNINHAFYGPMLFRQALGNSRNIPAMRVLADVGVEPALRFFDRAGVSGISWEPAAYGLGLAIGNLDVTLEELVGLYGVLAHEGVALPLRRFVDEPATPGVRLISREAAEMITDILSDPLARRPSFPTGGPLDFDYAVAIKTGTSGGNRDAWSVGYSDRLLVGVWVGNHDQRRMNHLTGARGAATTVHEILDALMPLRQPQRAVLPLFPAPEGYAAASICPLSGKLAGPDCPDHRVEYFAPGTAPTELCHYHARVPIDVRNGLRAGPGCPRRFVERRQLLDLPSSYAAWARRAHLELAPQQMSPLCPDAQPDAAPAIAITEPHDHARFLFDPDTPADYSTLRLSADVTPADEELVWLVDGTPVARVSYPFEVRWPLSPGKHTIVAALEGRAMQSRPVTVYVEN